jgi:hypothetical protein
MRGRPHAATLDATDGRTPNRITERQPFAMLA